MRINPVVDRLGAYPIATVRERASALAAAGKRVIDFSIGDPREPTPGFIVDALKAAVPAISQYPTTTGLPELRGAIAGYLRRRFDVTVDPESQIIPTSGSKEAIFSTALALVDRHAGDAVVYGTPGYPVYERGALFAGAVITPTILSRDFVLRPNHLAEETWERAKMVWVCTPHNPTGAVTDLATLGGFVERCRDRGAWLLSDECYADVYDPVVFAEYGPPSVLQAAGDGARGVLAFLSCSKRSGMTGYRSGAVVGDPEAIAALKRFRASTGTASPEFVQAAAVAAWSDDEHAARRREIFAAKRAVVRKAFDGVGFGTVASTAGLYLWIDVGDDVAVADRLLDGGVVVSPGRFFGPGGEGYVRLALVPTLEECEAAVEVVRACLGG